MPATRNYGTPRKQKSREDLAASMAVNGASSASVAMLNASYSYESGESSAVYEYNSQRSEEPSWDGYGDHPSSLRRRPPAVESMMESARLSDKGLHEVAAAAASGVNWGELDMELAAASLSEKHESVWKRKKLPRGYTNSDAMKLFTRLTIRDRRHQTRWGPKGFAVLAEGTLPCTVQEMRLVFRVASTDMFRDMMRCIYRREFVEGELLRTIKIQRGAGNPARAFENRELSVKTATFESGSMFSKNESWCFLEFLHPRDRAKEEHVPTLKSANTVHVAIPVHRSNKYECVNAASFAWIELDTPQSQKRIYVPRERARPTLKTRPASLNDLLLETLADATAGGEAQRKRKASVLSVMKDIVDEERARRRSSAARIRSASAGVTRRGLPLLGERDEEAEDGEAEEAEDEPVDDAERLKRMWGEAPRWEDDYPLANADTRSYQIEFPQDPMEAIIPPIPSNEYKRLQLIREQQLNELGDVPELGIICSLASKELACAVSMITVVDKAQLHVLASTHPAVPGGMSYPREQGFCAQTILDPHPLVSRHVQADVRFSAMSSVRKMGINFYCGFPLMGSDGKTVIGSVCCADPQARDLTRSQYAAMSSLASTASRVVQRAAEHRAVREDSADV
ncbi:hypothetical protein JG688_00003200 [Phytophthora aleatoria]|uniref:GAF domain-containing protein n=1 Tax=Phytophthora aleatoria TaxID=2496075 RepID=A0A8J5JEZ1_9STRA|nr:hypothetical protein JG688_00003200 [Phytophthora aleatoria]